MERIQALGKIVRQARKRQGLTQKNLAMVTGVGVRFIREVEGGKNSCHIGKVFTLLSMLGLDICVNGQTL